MTLPGTDDILWYAASNDISRMGPYPDQVSAWEALRVTDDIWRKTRREHADGARVWCERRNAMVRW